MDPNAEPVTTVYASSLSMATRVQQEVEETPFCVVSVLHYGIIFLRRFSSSFCDQCLPRLRLE